MMVCKKKSVENGIQNKLTSVKSNFKISTGIWPSGYEPTLDASIPQWSTCIQVLTSLLTPASCYCVHGKAGGDGPST